MCADVEALIEELKGHNVVCGPVQDEGWGFLPRLMLQAAEARNLSTASSAASGHE